MRATTARHPPPLLYKKAAIVLHNLLRQNPCHPRLRRRGSKICAVKRSFDMAEESKPAPKIGHLSRNGDFSDCRDDYTRVTAGDNGPAPEQRSVNGPAPINHAQATQARPMSSPAPPPQKKEGAGA